MPEAPQRATQPTRVPTPAVPAGVSTNSGPQQSSWGNAADEGWLAARGGTAFRERNALLGRLSALVPQVLETPDVEATRLELKRLLSDIRRHVQHLNDLAYDEVELELGGSD